MTETGEPRNGNGTGGNETGGNGTGGNGTGGGDTDAGAPGTTAEQAGAPVASDSPPPQAPAAPGAQPLFYTQPQPLSAATHAGKGLRRPVDYRFAAGAHAVVLQAQEFRLAAAHYPIVFADDEAAMPLAVLGFRERENLFVDSAGQWRAGAYIPAYVRRYPFASGQGAKADEAILYVDAASNLVVDLAQNPDAAPLFVDGEPSEETKRALGFCAAFQRQVQETRAFVAALKAHDLLESKEVRLDLPGAGQQLLSGLRIVDEARFNSLADDVFLDWRRNGWVALVHWHWASMDNFQRMVARR